MPPGEVWIWATINLKCLHFLQKDFPRGKSNNSPEMRKFAV